MSAPTATFVRESDAFPLSKNAEYATRQIGTCKTCKHFSPGSASPGTINLCYHPKLNSKPPHGLIGESMPPDNLQSLDIFVVGPDFGCIHHEVKS